VADRTPSAASVPLYQPGEMKVMRITLTEAQWWALSERLVAAKKSDEGPRTLEQFVNEIVREAADA
jgi:hypothetical protein